MSTLTLDPLVHPPRAPRELTQARWLFALLAVQFIGPALSYLLTPQLAIASLDEVNRMLGGGPYVVNESHGHVWHMLAVGNVMTLGFMCALLAIDLERFFPTLPALAFLKGFSALSSLALGLTDGPPLFLAVFVLDGATTVAMVVFGIRAHRALRRQRGEPVDAWWLEVVLLDTQRLREGVQRARRHGLVRAEVTPRQLWAGIVRMWGRVMFRSETVGTSTMPVRNTWRARLLHHRAVRLPFLLAERFVAPLDFSGLLSSPERVARHVLGAHHQPDQLLYDLELLSMHDGALERLEVATREVLEHDTPRTRWLKDLCVHEGYHESVLAAVQAYRATPAAPGVDPDLSFSGLLDWCSKVNARA